MIGIIDIKIGNLRSVFNSVYSLGYDVDIIQDKFDSKKFSHLIIPGVGSFNKVMKSKELSNFLISINEFAKQKKPILGICLGMHILAEIGFEGGKIKGLGFIPGEIHQIEINENIQIPHIGWNSVNFKFEHKILSGIKNNVDFYFVHSYFFKSPIKKNILAESKYGKFFFSCNYS